MELLPIGTKVRKISGKPFKSALKINTIKGYTTNFQTQKPAYLFEEDNTDVVASQCVAVLTGVGNE